MMDGRAFILLKARRPRPGNEQQVEFLLASLLKILWIAGSGGQKPPVWRGSGVSVTISTGYG
jgi:hypothetical protein